MRNKYNYVEIGERIRNERKKHKEYSDLREFVKALYKNGYHINKTTYSSLENGNLKNQRITVSQLMGICELLDIDMYYLLEGKKYINPKQEIISEELGLDTETIERLKKYTPKQKLMLKSLIKGNGKKNSKDTLSELLNNIYEYKMACTAGKATINLSIDKLKIQKKITAKNIINNLFKFEAIKTFEKLLDAPTKEIDNILAKADEMEYFYDIFLKHRWTYSDRIKEIENEIRKDIQSGKDIFCD